MTVTRVLVLGGRSGTPVMWVDLGVLMAVVLPIVGKVGGAILNLLERK